MIQRIILKFCGYVGCDDATNVSNFGYEPIKFSSFMLNIRMHTMQTRAVLRLECSLDCLSAPTYRYIAPRMIQRIILKFCGYVGCDDATNVSNFGYEPIKFNQLNQ